MLTRRAFPVAVAVGLAVAAAPTLARAGSIPVRIRILKGSRQGPPAFDARLSDLKGQLGRLAYVRWDQVSEQRDSMDPGRTVTVALPDGAALELSLVEARGDTVTFDVRVPQRRTHSRLTISRDQRIVHQVADEKGGVAYFASVRPWP